MRFKIIPRRIICLYEGWFPDTLKYIIKKGIRKADNVAEFEQRFSEYVGITYSFAVQSGRFGFGLILKALNIKENDEVILPAYTDESVPQTLINNKIKPVFVDLQRYDHNIDTALIEEKVTKNTKAIIATHIFGQLCNIKEIRAIADKYSLLIIEDCAHAFGTIKSGIFSDAYFFSLADSKPLTTFSGGMICTNSEKTAEILKKEMDKISLSDKLTLLKTSIIPTVLQFILIKRIIFSFFVYPIIFILNFFDKDILRFYNNSFKKLAVDKHETYKFSNYQGWIGINAIKSFEEQNRRRVNNAVMLRELLNPEILPLCKEFKSDTNIYFFVLVTKRKNDLASFLLKSGIDTGKYIMRNCPKMFGKGGQYPVTGVIYEESLQVPIHHTLSNKEIVFIADKINKFFRKGL